MRELYVCTLPGDISPDREHARTEQTQSSSDTPLRRQTVGTEECLDEGATATAVRANPSFTRHLAVLSTATIEDPDWVQGNAIV
jgi:hypothetical protein